MRQGASLQIISAWTGGAPFKTAARLEGSVSFYGTRAGLGVSGVGFWMWQDYDRGACRGAAGFEGPGFVGQML